MKSTDTNKKMVYNQKFCMKELITIRIYRQNINFEDA